MTFAAIAKNVEKQRKNDVFFGVIGVGIELLNGFSSLGYTYGRVLLDLWASLARNRLYAWLILVRVGRS